jgi:hypothetical protein
MKSLTHTTRRLAQSIICVLLVATLAAPAALAETRQSSVSKYGPLDAWAVNAIYNAKQASLRDYPDGRVSFHARVTDSIPATPPVAAVGDDSFDWSDAGMGAGSAFALALLATVAVLAIRGRSSFAHSSSERVRT